MNNRRLKKHLLIKKNNKEKLAFGIDKKPLNLVGTDEKNQQVD